MTKTRAYAPTRLAQRITPTTKLNKPDGWFSVIRMDKEIITENHQDPQGRQDDVMGDGQEPLDQREPFAQVLLYVGVQ